MDDLTAGQIMEIHTINILNQQDFLFSRHLSVIVPHQPTTLVSISGPPWHATRSSQGFERSNQYWTLTVHPLMPKNSKNKSRDSKMGLRRFLSLPNLVKAQLKFCVSTWRLLQQVIRRVRGISSEANFMILLINIFNAKRKFFQRLTESRRVSALTIHWLDTHTNNIFPMPKSIAFVYYYL